MIPRLRRLLLRLPNHHRESQALRGLLWESYARGSRPASVGGHLDVTAFAQAALGSGRHRRVLLHEVPGER